MTTPILTEAEVECMSREWVREEVTDYEDLIRRAETAVLAKLAAMNEPVAWKHMATGQLESAASFAMPYNWGNRSEWMPLYPPATQDREDALSVINAAREAMNESFEAGNNEADISIPSHLAAALSLALDEYDAALKGTP